MKKLTIGKKIGALLLFMVLIAVGNLLVIYRYQYMQEYDSIIVNIAGRQRMLSQKITKLVLSVANGNDKDRIPLRESIDLYESSLRILQYGGNVNGSLVPSAPDALNSYFEKNKILWFLFKQKAELVTRERRHNTVFSEAIAYMRENDEIFLEKSDDVVTAYDTLPASQEFAHEINVAGRQRMLSQKMSKYALFIAAGEHGDFRSNLKEAIQLYDASFVSMRNGGVSSPWGNEVKKPPPAVKLALDALEPAWHRYKLNAESIQSKPRDNLEFKEAVEFVRMNNNELLNVSDEVTGKFEEIFSGKAAWLRALLIIMLGGDVLIFIVGLLMANNLAKPIRELSGTAVRIGEGDFTQKIAIPDSNDEIRDLANAFVKMTEDLQLTTVSKNFVDDIMSSMTDILIVADMNKNITTVNEAACGILGYEDEEIIDLPFSEVLGGEGIDTTIYDKLAKEGSAANIEITCRTKTDHYIPMLFSGSLMKDKEGNLKGVVGIARDITERKQMEERERLRTLTLEECVNRLEDLVETLKLDVHLAKQILHILNGNIPRNIELPNNHSLIFHSISLSCHQEGGDHCFVREMPKNAHHKQGRTIISLKDQSGHAVDCMLRSLVTDMIHQALLHSNCDRPLEHMLTKLNSCLCGLNVFPLGKYFTSVDGEIDHDTLALRFSSSGHPPFIHIRGDNVRSYPVPGGPGHNSLPVVFDDIEYEAGELQLEPGDKLIFYTDGLMDAALRKDISIDVDELMLIIGEFTHMPVTDIMRCTMAKVAELSGEKLDPCRELNTSKDDITLLGVEIKQKSDSLAETLKPRNERDSGHRSFNLWELDG